MKSSHRPAPTVALILAGLASLLPAGGCSDSPTGPGNAVRHFTVVEPLDADSLAAAVDRFAAMNPHACSSLNGFGHTVGVCALGATGLPENPDLPSTIAFIKEELVRNAAFTGVADTADLTVSRTWVRSNYLQVSFADQRWQGHEVWYTVITVRADSTGLLSIQGSHFSDIKAPATDRISARAAQASLVGLEIPWYDFRDRRNIYTVTWDSFYGEPDKVVFPRWWGGTIELRVAWSIVVGGGWKIFVDTTSGEQVGIIQLFVT